MANNKVFHQITNRDIYQKIEQMHDDIKEVCSRGKANSKIMKLLMAWNLALTTGIITVAIMV